MADDSKNSLPTLFGVDPLFSGYQPVPKVGYHVYTKEGYRAMSGYVAGCRANPLKH